MRDAGTFYGWTVLGASVVLVALGTGTLFSLGVFLAPIVEAMGWSRSSVSSIAAVNWLVMGAGSQLWGALSDRIGIRKVAASGALLFGLGMVLSSQVTQVWQLYVTFSLLVGLGVSAFYAPLSATATRWFTSHRGLALGIVSAGIGVGILAMSPLSRWLITEFGWRTAMLLLGDIGWLVTLPAALLLRNSPADVGQLPLGGLAPAAIGSPATSFTAGPEPPGGAGSPSATAVTLSPPEATAAAGAASPSAPTPIYSTLTFWIIALTHFACCAAHSGPIFHMVTYATDRGVEKMLAASVLGVSGFASIAGRIGCGIIADRIGATRTLLVGLMLQAIMVFLYRFADGVASFYALAVVFGVAYGGVMPLFALIVRERFGERVMGRAYGGVFFISAFGMALGTYAGGWFYDHLGSYAWLYIGSALIGGMALLLALTLRPVRRLALAT